MIIDNNGECQWIFHSIIPAPILCNSQIFMCSNCNVHYAISMWKLAKSESNEIHTFCLDCQLNIVRETGAFDSCDDDDAVCDNASLDKGDVEAINKDNANEKDDNYESHKDCSVDKFSITSNRLLTDSCIVVSNQNKQIHKEEGEYPSTKIDISRKRKIQRRMSLIDVSMGDEPSLINDTSIEQKSPNHRNDLINNDTQAVLKSKPAGSYLVRRRTVDENGASMACGDYEQVDQDSALVEARRILERLHTDPTVVDDLSGGVYTEAIPFPPGTQPTQPTNSDVLCSYEADTYNHPGNLRFRALISLHGDQYLTAQYGEKTKISRSVVRILRQFDPPSRFLKKDPPTGLWFDMGEDKATKKTSKEFRKKKKITSIEQNSLNHRDDLISDDNRHGISDVGESLSSSEDKSNTDIWNIDHIFSAKDIINIKNNTHVCQGKLCKLRVCSKWVCKRTGDVWYSCRDCQESEFNLDGWPIFEKLAAHVAKDKHHMSIIDKFCSKYCG